MQRFSSRRLRRAKSLNKFSRSVQVRLPRRAARGALKKGARVTRAQCTAGRLKTGTTVTDYWISDRTIWLMLLLCLSIEVLACRRICFEVMLALSDA